MNPETIKINEISLVLQYPRTFGAFLKQGRFYNRFWCNLPPFWKDFRLPGWILDALGGLLARLGGLLGPLGGILAHLGGVLAYLGGVLGRLGGLLGL